MAQFGGMFGRGGIRRWARRSGRTFNPDRDATRQRALHIFIVFLRLGCVSFGGVVPQIAALKQEAVLRQRWMNESSFDELTSFSLLAPGFVTAQLAMAIGLIRAGRAGLLAALLGFATPSTLIMLFAAYHLDSVDDVNQSGWLHGVVIAAVALVIDAVWTLAAALRPFDGKLAITAAALVLALGLPNPFGALAGIAVGAAAGLLMCARQPATTHGAVTYAAPVSRSAALIAAATYCGLLCLLPLVAFATNIRLIGFVSAFYLTGVVSFSGGGLGVPMLQNSVVDSGWVSLDMVLAGFALSRALPGPTITFVAFVGFLCGAPPNGVAGGLIAAAAVLLPSALIVPAALPAWGSLQSNPSFRAAMRGVNAAVVGLLASVLFSPRIFGDIASSGDVAFVLLAVYLMSVRRTPRWAVVGLGAIAGATGLLTAFSLPP